MRLYLAGPLFTAAEVAFNRALARDLRDRGHEVWLPQEQEVRSLTASRIFAIDVAGIDGADAVVACMDGPDPDSGTCWECGYAYAKGKPVVVFRTDFRSITEGGKAAYNLMLTESAAAAIEAPLAGIAELGGRIDRALSGLSA